MSNKFVTTLNPNEIPYELNSNWNWYRWSDIIESYQQGLIRSNSELNPDNGFDYFKMNFINTDGSYTFNGLPKTYATEDEIESYKLESGDYLINVRNSKELVGKSCVIYGVDKDILFNHMLVRIKHKQYITGSYINAYFNTDFGRKLLDTCKKGTTTVIALYQRDLYDLPIPIPSEHILKHIDSIYNSINRKIELNNRINAELEAMAKTVYDYWFVQFDFPNTEGKPYKSNGGKMVWCEELKREVPEGWKVKNLFNAMDVQYGFPFSTEHFTDEIKLKPVVRIRDILENSISTYTTEDVDDKYMLLKNDLIIGMDGNFHLNFWYKTGAYLNQRSVRIRSIKDSNISSLQAYFELRPYIKAKENSVSRTTVGHLSDKDLKGLFLLDCNKTNFKPKEFFDSILDKITTNRVENQQLSSLRDWLLPMLMNGQVSVNVQEEMEVERLMVAEAEVEYKSKNAQLDYYHKIESVYVILWANKLLGVQQGEMALAKDTYLVDKLAGIETGYTFAQHNWGSYDPAFKKTINNKQYFVRRNFENSKATYFDLNDNEKLLTRIPETTKEAVRKTVEELHSKVFYKYQWSKKAEMKELYATVLKCIEDTQSIDMTVIRQAMKDWKTPKQDFPNKAAKFSEQLTKESLDMIVKEGWSLKVMKG
jgi:type I restriction enzyme S subunit